MKFCSPIFKRANIHQYQRTQDEQGRYLTTKADIQNGLDIFFEALWINIDELDPSTRQFFDQLKHHLKINQTQTKPKETNPITFILRDIRQALNVSRSALHRYIQSLIKLGYITIASGTANRGYQYAISYWDDAQQLKNHLKQNLQFTASLVHPTSHGTPKPH